MFNWCLLSYTHSSSAACVDTEYEPLMFALKYLETARLQYLCPKGTSQNIGTWIANLRSQ